MAVILGNVHDRTPHKWKMLLSMLLSLESDFSERRDVRNSLSRLLSFSRSWHQNMRGDAMGVCTYSV